MGRVLLFGFHFFLIAVICYVPLGFFWTLYLGSFNFIDFSSMFFLFNLANLFFLLAFLAFVWDFLIMEGLFRKQNVLKQDFLTKPRIVVGMTAYNDEKSIGSAVKDFLSHPLVSEVIVVDNNSVDNTSKVAKLAGATVVSEKNQGYGFCCRRALKEANMRKPDLICLVEGDMTFSSKDLDKLLAYSAHSDMVLGTRTTQELQDKGCQMNLFINLGNQFISKLIQLRFWGKCRLTDVGCTFRLIRPDAYEKIRTSLKIGGNHFSPHMILESLKKNLKILEVPVTLKERVGVSKGVGNRHFRGFLVGLKMWWLILRS